MVNTPSEGNYDTLSSPRKVLPLLFLEFVQRKPRRVKPLFTRDRPPASVTASTIISWFSRMSSKGICLSSLPADILLYIVRFSGLLDNVSFSMVRAFEKFNVQSESTLNTTPRFAKKRTLYQPIDISGFML